MSSPSFENIDRWFFEYIEGNLSSDQIEEFHDFITRYPELQEELEEWEATKINPIHSNFSSNHLTRSTPLSTYLLIGTGISTVIVSAFFILSYFNTISPHYFKQELDLTLIEEELSDFYTEEKNAPLVRKPNTKETPIALNPTTKENTKPAIAFTSQTSFNTNSNNTTSTQPETTIYDNNQTNVKIVTENKDLVQSHHLTSVIESIESNNIQAPTSYKKVSKNQKSQQFRRRFSATVKTIKKMADQPVALSNSRDPHFHVPNKMGYQANFGMAGTLLRDRVQMTSRNQFVGQDNQHFMNQVSWDSYVYALRGGVGIDMSYTDYNRGSINNFEVGLTYSPKFSVSKNISIEPALRFKTGTIDLNQSSPIIGQSVEINRANRLTVFPDGDQPIGSQLLYRDLGTGVLVNTKWFYAGVNLDNIRRHYNNFYSNSIDPNQRASLHFSGIAGTDYSPVGKDIRYSAYLFYQNFGTLNELWTGFNIQWKFLEIGGGASTNLDFGSSLGIKLDQVSLHYNIDYLTSVLLDEQLLSHQLSMRYLFKPSRQAIKLLNL